MPKGGVKHKGPCEGQPYGYTLTPDAGEQRVIKRIRRLSEEGYSQRDIAEFLNQKGVMLRGRPWHQGTISRILARNGETA